MIRIDRTIRAAFDFGRFILLHGVNSSIVLTPMDCKRLVIA
ncbi:hypothetical protein [Primorskyibacter flagellatus]